MDGSISWRSFQNTKASSNIALDDWHQGDQEMHSRRCVVVYCAHWTGNEVRDCHYFNGIGFVSNL